MSGSTTGVTLGRMSFESPYKDSRPQPRCRYCGDVIGAYEPLVMKTETGELMGSIATDPHLFPTDEPCYHPACHQLAGADDASSWGDRRPRPATPGHQNLIR
jgi:hypothetical protein